MELIFYYILRRFFVQLHMENGILLLRKGLVLRRHFRIPFKAVRRIDIRRTPLLRLLHGKKVTVHTFSGKVSFYLQRNENLSFIPHSKAYPTVRPRFSSVLAGAFSQTKALGGTILFSVTTARLGSLFGSGYYDAFTKLISDTAKGLDDLLSELRIAVPRITAVLAVFVAAAWLFAFIRNTIHLSRYTVIFSRKHVTIRHGLITLYESIFPSDVPDAVIIRDTATTLASGAAPIYRSRKMVIPPLCGEKRRKALKLLYPAPCYDLVDATPPPKALFGHIAVPLGWGIASAALLILTYLTISDPVLRTLLWGILWVNIWFCILFGVYMRRSGITQNRHVVIAAARKGSELLTAHLPPEAIAFSRTDSNPFQRKTGMCDLRLYAQGRIKLRLRNIRSSDISEPL